MLECSNHQTSTGQEPGCQQHGSGFRLCFKAAPSSPGLLFTSCLACGLSPPCPHERACSCWTFVQPGLDLNPGKLLLSPSQPQPLCTLHPPPSLPTHPNPRSCRCRAPAQSDLVLQPAVPHHCAQAMRGGGVPGTAGPTRGGGQAPHQSAAQAHRGDDGEEPVHVRALLKHWGGALCASAAIVCVYVCVCACLG